MRIGLAMIFIAIVLAASLGFYFATITVARTTPVTTQSSSPYQLALIEPMNSAWNMTLAQPQFFVVGSGGLKSSANISLPVNRMIQLTIVSYDTPTTGSTDQEGVVSGTVGGTVYLINGTGASMSSMPEPWGKNVTSIPGAALAHTFSIPQLNINVPVVGGDTTIAYLYFTKPGTYSWTCLTPCGFGPNGAQGAMSKPGWMTGTITVS
jgi:heme/copper-type cytochrome/quinol oxidase subunit 2